MPGAGGGVAGVGVEGQRVGPGQRRAAEGAIELGAHAQRWQARPGGVPVSTPAPKVGGFVAARLPGAIGATVRIELHAGSTRLELHWPVANARDLAAWLREVGR